VPTYGLKSGFILESKNISTDLTDYSCTNIGVFGIGRNTTTHSRVRQTRCRHWS
jgi:hypothetical protein